MNQPTNTKQHDVIIVGGGPVGLGLSIDLALKGIRSLVIERSEQLHQIPKGQNLTQRTGEHFRYWGVSEQIRANSPIARSFGNAGMVAWGKALGDYHYDWFKRGSVNEFYFAENERLPQYLTEKVLRERAAQLDQIQIVYGAQAQDVQQFDDRVEVRWAQASESGTAVAPYLVGCDGSRSATREAAGIEQDIDPHDKRMVLLVLRSKQLHDLLERFPGKSIINVLNPALQGYWQFLGRTDLNGGFFFHAPVPPGTTKDNFDFTHYLHEAIGAEFAVEFEHIGFWDLRLAVARTFRAQRIFVAGDAAHSHPPYGGYGVNLGFEDARNLSWKLAAQIQGWAGDNLLDSYDAERKPVVESTLYEFVGQMIRDDRQFADSYSPQRDLAAFKSAWQQRAVGGNDAVTDYLPHYEGSPVCMGEPTGTSGARGKHDVRAKAGHHLAPAAPDVVPLSDRYLLIAAPVRLSLAHEITDIASRRRIPMAMVESEQATQAYGSSLVLVRPDGFVCWAANGCSNIDGLINTVVGH